MRIILFIVLTTLSPRIWNQSDQLVGSEPPPLEILQWIKGDSEILLERGRVYVIDFWATWCIPCIREFDQLSHFQREYGADVSVIGISSEDKWGNTLESVQQLVADRLSSIDFKMAWVAPSDPPGIFNHPWMHWAETSSLPRTFIIDKKGRLAYIREPNNIGHYLDQVVKGSHDLKENSAILNANRAAMDNLNRFKERIQARQYQDALQLVEDLLQNEKVKEPKIFSMLASRIAENNELLSGKWQSVCLRAAKKSVLLSMFRSSGYLDTLALAYAKNGDPFEAVITEMLAIHKSEGRMKQEQIVNLGGFLKLLDK